MAKNAMVFSGRNGLDFSELRAGVMRIPEVTIRIREAQAVLDSLEPKVEIDLLSTITGDDDHFFRNIKLKSLASAIVQVGLFDRLQKSQRRIDFMVGNSNGDSAMMVCAGLMTFKEMIMNSQAISSLSHTEKVVPINTVAALAMPLLSGLSLTEYNALKAAPGEGGVMTFSSIPGGAMDLRKIIASLHQDHDVTRFVNIGPASALRGSDYRALGSGDVESVDSIELDPMLGWFWRNISSHASALAQ